MSNARLAEVLETLEAAVEHKDFNSALFFKPYPKQKAFFDLGSTKRERLFMAGNQVGKSHAGAFETYCHATGQYPADWKGKKFKEPTRGWVAGVTSLDTRNIQQKKLLGDPGVVSKQGTGMIPKDRIIDVSLARGVTDAIDTVQVAWGRKGDGAISTIHFKSYEQGRAKFQGDTIHYGWGDEEPEKMEVYSEFLTRLRGDGILYTTFTPLFGNTELVMRFTDQSSEDRGVVHMTLDEAQHFTAEEKKKRLEGYARHEREARSRGVPLLGSGRVFIVDEELIKEPQLTYMPAHWVKLWGIDFGIGHPFAAVLIVWDRDNDVIHVHHALRMVEQGEQRNPPLLHAAAMKPIGADVPVAWPQDGTAREKGSGHSLAKFYKDAGLRMLDEHATFPDGGYSTEAGIKEMEERMMTGRLKVANHLEQWFEEYRTYHRKDGQIVKIRDDLMSATRVAVMMKRAARAVILGGDRARRHTSEIADGVDFDIFDMVGD